MIYKFYILLIIINQCIIIESKIFTPLKYKTEKSANLFLDKIHNKKYRHIYENGNICVSDSCFKTSYLILRNIDTSVDPCDDFYQFACGKYIKGTHIPSDKSTVNIPHSIGDLLEAKLRIILEEPVTSDDLRPFELAKRFYKTCMNTAAIEKVSIQTLKNYLYGFGGWPVLVGNNWNEDNFDWQQITFDLHEAGFGSSFFLRIYVFLDPKNSFKTILFIHQALLGLKREYLTKGKSDKLVNAYYNYMVDVAVMLGANKNFAQKELEDSLEFEMKLANISLPKEALRNFTTLYNPMTVMDLDRNFPGIKWFAFLTKLLNGVPIRPSEVIILQAPNYIRGLTHLLNITPKRVQANYIFWRVVENSVTFLNTRLRKRLLHYTKAVSGTTALPPRWRECVAVVNNGMPIAIGAIYVRKYFHRAEKKEAESMVRNIRQELYNILQDVKWMDKVTLKKALDKLKSMEAHVGYPDELLNDTLLEQYYDRLEIRENEYLESVLEITKFERLYEFRSLHSPVNKSSWVDHGNAAVVNAFYTFSENSINLPAGILQEQFFSIDRPRYMNYGAIGSVIGHEIIHGYDDKGRQYDKNGNLVDWWEEETNRKFMIKAQCFINQYTSYQDKHVKLNLNGINTQGENIADNGGVKAAYLAYRHWVYKTGITEPYLPGLTSFTPYQMFWLAMANAFCAKSRPEYTQLIITTDEHSPAVYRVLGTLSNLDEFSADFQCPIGTRMNPRNKCILW